MTKLKRVLGPTMLTFYGIGMILGAGIYSIIGKATAIAGVSVWLSLLIAAIIATLAALSYAELSSLFPLVGGEYVYLKNAFPRHLWIASTIGLMMSFAAMATSAAVALAFAGYLLQFFSLSSLLVAFCLLVFFTLVNIAGIKEASWVNIIFTLIEIIGLLIFVYFGVRSSHFGNAIFFAPSFTVFPGSALIIFAYFGFENIVNFIEEAKDPAKNIPRAILLSVGISTVLYVFVALSAVSLLPVAELARSQAPLSDAIMPLSVFFAEVLSTIALFATANTVLISQATTSRILLGMGRDGVLPKAFVLVHEKKQTPWFSILVFLLLTGLLLFFNEKIETLASVSSLATLIAFSAVHIALIKLRFQNKEVSPEIFKVPFSIKKMPILPLLGLVGTFFLSLQFDSIIYYISGSGIAVIIFFQFLFKRLKS